MRINGGDLRKPLSGRSPPIVNKMIPSEVMEPMHYQWILRESVTKTDRTVPSNYDHPFYMVILEGVSVTGVHLVVLGLSDRISGFLGNLAPVFPPRRWWARRQHVGIWQFVSGAHSEQVLRKYVSLFSNVLNCRNCELFNVCDIYMCCNQVRIHGQLPLFRQSS